MLSVAMQAEIPSGYYNNAQGKTGEDLKIALHSIIHTHTRLSYDDVWDALKYTDEDPDNTNNVILLYSGWSYPKSNNGGGVSEWNREHTWAKSQGDFGTSQGPGTDIHHLRPTDVTVNSARGSMKFDEGGNIYTDASRYGGGDGTTSCKKGSDNWEPADEVKGDVARMLFYMATCYETEDGVDLELAESSSTSGKHGRLSTLLKWHEQDPVSDWEIRRNNRAQEKQGNRNPFIDHPEYVCWVWGDGACDTSTTGGGTVDPEPIDSTADVTINMSSSDYQIIIDYVNANNLPNASTYDDSEYYYGASSHYTNFDIRDGKRNSSFATVDDAIVAALRDAFLPNKISSSLLNVDYIVNYATFSGENATGSKTYHCSSVDPLAFTLGAATEEPVDTTPGDSAVTTPLSGLELLSYGTAATFDVVTWNIEHFPTNNSTTIDKVKQAIIAMDVEVIAVQEVDDTAQFNQMIRELEGYSAYVTGAEYANLAYIYKSELAITTPYTIYDSEWSAFPRRPLVLELSFNDEDFVIINNHLKCCGDGTLDLSNTSDEEYRRLQASIKLKSYIDTNLSDKAVLVVGDFNDVLEDAVSNNIFQNFIDDDANYAFADMSIALGATDNWSYKSWPSHLDHILVTDEVFGRYNCKTLKPDSLITWDVYDADVSDHRPVGIRIAKAGEVQEPVDALSSLNLTFDNDLDNCTMVQVSGTTAWGQTAYNENGYAVINTYQNGANEAWLITPAVDMDGLDNEVFTFSITSYNSNKTVGECGAGQFEVFYSSAFDGSTINSSDWTRFTSVDNVQLGDKSWVWVEVELDVTAIAGQAVYFAFAHKSDDSNGTTWEVDNVKLSGDVASAISPNEAPLVALYPNPAEDNISLSRGANSLEILTLSGRSVLQLQQVKAQQLIDVSSLKSGIYIVKIDDIVTKVALR